MERKTQRTASFTLIEMLVVIGIIGLLTLIALPAFQDANRGSRVRTAIFQLNTSMSLARQNAITTRQETYILFPDYDVDYDADSVHLGYRAYAIYGAGDGYIGEWRELPDGVVFDNTLYPTRNIFNQTSTKAVPFPNNASSGSNLILALTYRPDGTLDSGFNVRAVYLTEGWVDVAPGSTDIAEADLQFRPEASIFGLEIRPESGQARSREYNPAP